jgi:tRNA(fMet)-specific endonuclease VapC
LGALIDTSVFIHVERGHEEIVDQLAAVEGDVALAAVTASELLHGVHLADAKHFAVRQAFVERVLGTVPIVPFDLGAARVHAKLWADLRRAGKPVGERDLLIAATAIANGHEVIACDARSFPLIPGLKTFLWTAKPPPPKRRRGR